MNKKEIFLFVSVVMVILIAIYFYTDNLKLKQMLEKSDSRLDSTKSILNKMKEDIQKHLDSEEGINEKVKSEIVGLIDKYRDVDNKVVGELAKVNSLIATGHNDEALQSMTKIIERLLKKIHGVNGDKKRMTLSNMIQKSKEDSVISNEEYYALQYLRELRNKLSHEIDVNFDSNKSLSALLLCVGVIVKLGSLVTRT